MNESIQEFFLSLLAYGGGSTAIAFFVFRYLAKGWIDSRFSKSLEHFKHQQAKEINRMKIEIDSTLSGVLKIQDKEFETLPVVWEKLDDAYRHVAALVSPYQQYPDFNRMRDDEIEEILSDSGLRESAKNDIRRSSDRLSEYMKKMFYRDIYKAKNFCRDLNKYVIRYGIFFPDNIKSDLEEICDMLFEVVEKRELAARMDDRSAIGDAWEYLKIKIKPAFDDIRNIIHKRLQAHGRVE